VVFNRGKKPKPHPSTFQRRKFYKKGFISNFHSKILCPREEVKIYPEVSVPAQLYDGNGNSLMDHRGWTGFTRQRCWERLEKSASCPDEKGLRMPK